MKTVGLKMRGPKRRLKHRRHRQSSMPTTPNPGRLTARFGSHAKAFAFDDDGLGVVQQTIEDGSGQGTVIVEHLGHS